MCGCSSRGAWMVLCIGATVLGAGVATGMLGGAGRAGAARMAAAALADDTEPPVVTPGQPASDRPTPAPSDAIVLFDGTSLDAWQAEKGGAAGWKVEGVAGGSMTIEPGTGSIVTKRSFGDAQFHIEFATPKEVSGEGQGRGNSGVYLQGRYEVQVLDSYENKTYFNGQCAAIYGQHPPLVNACRKPGEWQTYDIIFTAPKFGADGKVTTPARITVLHNGVLVQNNVEATNPTATAQDGPLMLQDHNNRGRYRNIWVRQLSAATAGAAK